MNNLNLLPCKILVNKFANIFSVGKCLILIFPCFTLLSTQKNLITMCIDLLKHEIFPFSAILSAVSLSCQFFWLNWLYLCFKELLILNVARQILTVSYHLRFVWTSQINLPFTGLIRQDPYDRSNNSYYITPHVHVKWLRWISTSLHLL